MKFEEKKLICESAQKSAEHYNNLIWTVFSVGVALSLWILYNVWPSKESIGFMQLFMLIVGFLVLYYCILSVESFGQKKTLMYKIFNDNIKDYNFEKKIKDLPYKRMGWIAEIILFIIFVSYLMVALWKPLSSVLLNYRSLFKIILSWLFFVVALYLFFIILNNWWLRFKMERYD